MSHQTRVLTVCFFLIVAGLFLMGCATTAITTSCTPSSDLPAKKQMQKVPETPAGPEHLYDLLVDERRGRSQDQRDYNSLYRQCVSSEAPVDDRSFLDRLIP